ncbi:MAG: UDP-glucose:undecaprenyl-phosphate glucose-1-phosphate transferase [Rhodocyclaceae bacterium]|nr:undecaprenyl-phosphate glucose phosphotransferase [Zoogloeaceae bacterium]MBV6409141.1 UDP-glucose:undecaprenyl-phosphate glucose-1-phosphate transferase [Rhodocyclaceae bacterium]
MLAVLGRQQNLLRTRLTLVSLLGILLEPALLLGSLAAVAAYHEEAFSAPYVILALIVFSLSFPGTSRLNDRYRRIVRGVVIDWVLLAGLLLLLGYASGYLAAFREEVVLGWLAAAPLSLIVAHAAAKLLVLRVLASQDYQKTAVVAGINGTGLRLAQQFREQAYLGTRLVGFFDDRSRQRLGELSAGHDLLGRLGELAVYVKQHRIDAIYISLPMASQPRIVALLDDLRDTTASVYFAPDIFLTDLIQGRVDDVGGMPVVAICDSPFSGVSGLVKRTSDIVLSLLILLLVSPLMLAIAAGVKLSSPGPVLFRQRRYGVDGKEIVVYKFRSMTVCEDGAQIAQATKNDSRVTRLGAFLRKSSLDELPQFVNVLQGRMSIVGPRPHAVAHNELYRKLIKGYMVRHKVKPGITGLAQVSGYRGETETVEKMQKRIEYDLEYLRQWSLGLDLWIIFKTVLVVLRDRNAY